jgi:glycine cleavage system H protein
MNVPGDLKYTKDHEWARVDGDTVVMGITEFAQSELGELVFVDLPAAGRTFKKGDSICVVESTKAASDVYSPVSGTVKENNGKLTDRPDLVNTSPYTDGWMVRLEKVNTGDLDAMMSAAQYTEYLSTKG